MAVTARTTRDLSAVFTGLKELLARYADLLQVQADRSEEYCLVTVSKSRRGGHMYFGAVRAGKNYVSYHLMPVYSCPGVAAAVTPALRRRGLGAAGGVEARQDGGHVEFHGVLGNAGFHAMVLFAMPSASMRGISNSRG